MKSSENLPYSSYVASLYAKPLGCLMIALLIINSMISKWLYIHVAFLILNFMHNDFCFTHDMAICVDIFQDVKDFI